MTVINNPPVESFRRVEYVFFLVVSFLPAVAHTCPPRRRRVYSSWRQQIKQSKIRYVFESCVISEEQTPPMLPPHRCIKRGVRHATAPRIIVPLRCLR